MTARAVDEAGDRLRKLRQDERSELGLGGVAMGLALTASVLHPPLALPLVAGAFALLGLGLRALVLRWELFDRLLLEPDAYAISEVHRRAQELASTRSRRELARSLRLRLDVVPGYPPSPRVAAVSADLAALARELDDETLALDPWCAARCEQLVTSVADSPLLNDALPGEELFARINQIRAGFRKLS